MPCEAGGIGSLVPDLFKAKIGKDLGSLQHRGDEALTLRVAGAYSNLKHSMMK